MFFDLIGIHSNSAKSEDDNIAVNGQGKNVALFYFLSVTVKAKREFKEKVSYVGGPWKEIAVDEAVQREHLAYI